MRYKLILTGGEHLIITEKQKEVVSPYMGKEVNIRLAVGNNEILSKSMKAILEIKEDSVANFDRKATDDQELWRRDCRKLSELPIDEKIQKDMNVRILPGLMISRAEYPQELLEDLELAIRNFYRQYPYYPRCPFFVWSPLIKQYITKLSNTTSSWWLYVQKNDDAISRFVEFDIRKATAR